MKNREKNDLRAKRAKRRRSNRKPTRRVAQPARSREPEYRTEPIARFFRRMVGKWGKLTPQQRGEVFESAKARGRAIRLLHRGNRGVLVQLGDEPITRYSGVAIPLVDGFPEGGLLRVQGVRGGRARDDLLRAAMPVFKRVFKRTGSRDDALNEAQAFLDSRVAKLKLDSSGRPIRLGGFVSSRIHIVQGGSPGSGKKR